MGTLILKIYPVGITLGLADHTYVECGTGRKGWGCWGGKTGGKAVQQGAGSTKRADMIAGPDERAGITCYLINGVCHTAANRILLPANILIDRNLVRGSSLSEAIFGLYGKMGIWPCKAPFNQHSSVTGDLPECVQIPKAPSFGESDVPLTPVEPDARETAYIRGVLDIYATAAPMMDVEEFDHSEAEAFHSALFMYMARFRLGRMLDNALSSRLVQARGKIEEERAKVEAAFAKDEIPAVDFVNAFNQMTIAFQDEMASIMSPAQYQAFLNLEPGDHAILADPSIVKNAYGVDMQGSASGYA